MTRRLISLVLMCGVQVLTVRYLSKSDYGAWTYAMSVVVLLQTVATLWPLHGYAIAARLEQVSSGALRLNMGTLYPGLMRLEQQGLVKAEWGVTDNNRQARFYAITAAGRRRLASEKKAWDQMVSVMHTLFEDPA